MIVSRLVKVPDQFSFMMTTMDESGEASDMLGIKLNFGCLLVCFEAHHSEIENPIYSKTYSLAFTLDGRKS
jgi:hypothetical protein